MQFCRKYNMAQRLYSQSHATPIVLLSRLASLNPHFDVSAYLDKFHRLRTNVDRVNFVYKDLRKYKLFPKLKKQVKSDADAQLYRECGNGVFNERKYDVAFRLYSASLLTAKSASVLALAYANRSACLYMMKKYKECLIEIERALSSNYPEMLKPKLLRRRQNAQKMLELRPPLQSYHEDTPQFNDLEKHSLIQCAKNCVKIETNEDFGRHIVATRDIQIGEILCIENPYASVVNNDRFTHCHMCLELCYNTIPCDNCPLLLFCSEECKNKANNTFHKYECPIFLTLLECGMTDLENLGLRVAISAKRDWEHVCSLNLIGHEETYWSDRYKEFHNLMTGTDKQDIRYLFELTVTASLMYHLLLNHTDFFNGEIMKRNFKEVVLVQLEVVLLNTLDIQKNLESFHQSEQETFGRGLYAFASLFNHSCCPNIEKIQYGSTMVFRTVNTIKKDQQCFVSYGVTYGNTSKLIRQLFLRQYCLFDCRCEACEKDWHSSDDLVPFKFPVLIDVQLSNCEAMLMKLELTSQNVDAAKYYLPPLIRQLRKCENFEPRGNALKIKRLVIKCYHILGNKKI